MCVGRRQRFREAMRLLLANLARRHVASLGQQHGVDVGQHAAGGDGHCGRGGASGAAGRGGGSDTVGTYPCRAAWTAPRRCGSPAGCGGARCCGAWAARELGARAGCTGARAHAPGLLVVAAGVAGQLQHLSGQVLQHGGQVHRRAGAHTAGVLAGLQVASHTAHRELEARLGGAAHSLLRGLSLATARHVERVERSLGEEGSRNGAARGAPAREPVPRRSLPRNRGGQSALAIPPASPGFDQFAPVQACSRQLASRVLTPRRRRAPDRIPAAKARQGHAGGRPTGRGRRPGRFRARAARRGGRPGWSCRRSGVRQRRCGTRLGPRLVAAHLSRAHAGVRERRRSARGAQVRCARARFCRPERTPPLRAL